MTLTFRDKVILLILAFAACIYVGYQALWIPATAKIAELEENKLSIQNLAGDLEPLKDETDRLKKAEKEVKESVNNIKNLSGGFLHQEALSFLFAFCLKGGVICISEVTDVSPGNLDSSLCFIQPGILHDVFCI